MTRRRTLSRSLLLAIMLLAALPAYAAQQAPAITKVEPPNWWPGHSINPVRVLIRGRNLSGARVEAAGQGLSVGLVRANARGTYLFVDVLIDPAAAPGRRALRITTPAGVTQAPFEITAPLDRAGRFQGFTHRRRDLLDNARPFQRRRPRQ